MRGRMIAAIAAAGLVVLGAAGWLVLSPRWAVAYLQQQAQAQLGRNLSVKGGASLSLSPLAIRLDGASLAGQGDSAESVLTVGSLVIPVSFTDLLAHSASFSKVTLERAEFALLIDERGQASWDIPDASLPDGMSVTLEDASIRYFDARNAQSLSMGGLDGIVETVADGGLGFRGTAVMNGRIVRIDAALKSLPRVNADGSPLDLAIEAPEAKATFSGRIATAQVLSLTGPMSLVSPDPAATARWAGLSIPDGITITGPLNIDGGLDSAGRAFAVRRAALTVGGFRGAGDVVLDLRAEVPKLQAALKTQLLALDNFLPASGARPGEWGRTRIAFGLLKSFDAEIELEAEALGLGPLNTGPARVTAKLSGGKLETVGSAQLAEGGSVSFGATADATVLPPAMTASLKAANAAIAPLAAAAGIGFLSGSGNVSASVAASGLTQEEMVGTLKGEARVDLAQGQMTGTSAADLFEGVRRQVVEGWGAPTGSTPFTSFAADATISDGILAIGQFALDAPDLTLSVTGGIDLLRRALDLRASPRLKTAGPDGVTALPVPIVVHGPWEAPRIYPDVPNLLKDPKAGYETLGQMAPPPGN